MPYEEQIKAFEKQFIIDVELAEATNHLVDRMLVVYLKKYPKYSNSWTKMSSKELENHLKRHYKHCTDKIDRFKQISDEQITGVALLVMMVLWRRRKEQLEKTKLYQARKAEIDRILYTDPSQVEKLRKEADELAEEL